MGVWEYFDEHGAVRVEFDGAYGNGRFGAVPASEAQIAKLPAATAGQDQVSDKDCAVCMESFQDGEELRKMTCPSSHAFHETCIFKWLRVSRICPLCRFALRSKQEEEEANTSTEPAEKEADACQHRE